MSNVFKGPSWSWSYGSWIHNYLCNQCLSPLTLRVPIQFRRGVPDTKLCDKTCQWLHVGRCFFQCIPVSHTNKTDDHFITEILLKVALKTTTSPLSNLFTPWYSWNTAHHKHTISEHLKIINVFIEDSRFKEDILYSLTWCSILELSNNIGHISVIRHMLHHYLKKISAYFATK